MIYLSQEATDFFLSIIKIKPLSYLKYLFVRAFTPHDDHTFVMEPFWRQIFGGPDEFNDFLYGIDSEEKIVNVAKELLRKSSINY